MTPRISPQTLPHAMPLLVDPRVGIIQSVQEVKRVPGAPNFFHFVARACNTNAFTRQKNFRFTGGASSDRDRAIFKAVGEAVERYCSAIYDCEDFPVATREEASFNCFPPSEYALYSEAQYGWQGFPWAPFTDETPVRWTRVQDALTDELWHVPAAMVYIPYIYYRAAGEAPVVQSISTGLAAHSSTDRAKLHAIYEVMERDAFTITWQGLMGPPQIRVDTLEDEAYDLVQRFERIGDTIYLFDLSMDHGVPTILSVLKCKHPEGPALVFAAATALDPRAAVRSALEELAHTRRYSQQIKSKLPRLQADSDFLVIENQIDHLNFYTDHANAHYADFIFTTKKRISFDEIQNLSTCDDDAYLELVAQRIKSVGHRVLFSDLTTADIASVGLSVVRALIPGFHPLFMGHSLRALGGSRLWNVPKKLGYAALDPQAGDNPAPHPYP